MLKLPLIKKELSEQEKEKIQSNICFFNKRILIVEDEISISQVQRHILSQPPCNHDVDVASNGKQAIDLFETKTYDLISLDFVLPGDLSGMDVYQHIRKTNSTVLI